MTFIEELRRYPHIPGDLKRKFRRNFWRIGWYSVGIEWEVKDLFEIWVAMEMGHLGIRAKENCNIGKKDIQNTVKILKIKG